MSSSVFSSAGDLQISQLIGSSNTWALDLWKKGCENHWLPQEVSMHQDIQDWLKLSDQEKLVIKRTLGLFSAGESLVSASIDFVEKQHIRDGAARQYLDRKVFEESLHNFTVATCLDAFGLSVEEVAQAYINIPSVKKIAEFISKSIDQNAEKLHDTIPSRKAFVKNVFIIYMIIEGMMFFSNFAAILSMKKQGKIPGLGSQIFYTLRDEVNHVEFGTNVLINIKENHPEIWDTALESELKELMVKGLQLANEYTYEMLPTGMLGLNSSLLTSYNEFLANLRLASLGMEPLSSSTTNPLPWISEAQEGDTIAAFFEVRERSYRLSIDNDLDDW